MNILYYYYNFLNFNVCFNQIIIIINKINFVIHFKIILLSQSNFKREKK